MRRALAIALLLALLPAAALAEGSSQGGSPQSSVLVATETPRQGSLPRTLTAYGVIQAAPGGGSETLRRRSGISDSGDGFAGLVDSGAAAHSLLMRDD